MSRASVEVKDRLQHLDVQVGYGSFTYIKRRRVDREIYNRGWVRKVGDGCYRITENGRRALKRHTGRRSLYA